MIYTGSITEMWGIFYRQFLDRFIPDRRLKKAIRTLRYESIQTARKAKAISEGDQYSNMDLAAEGLWAEIADGLWARRVIVPEKYSRISKRMDIIEVNALKDVDEDIVHRHFVDNVRSNQLFFVESGEMSVELYDKYDGNVTKTYKIGCGEAFLVIPEQFHAAKFKKGTAGISIYLPPVS